MQSQASDTFWCRIVGFEARPLKDGRTRRYPGGQNLTLLAGSLAGHLVISPLIALAAFAVLGMHGEGFGSFLNYNYYK